MARQRNNIYAVAADAVDLALDTAGTIGSMVGSVASVIGIGGSEPEKSEAREKQEQKEKVDNAADRMVTSLHQEAELARPRSHATAKPRAHKVRAHAKPIKVKAHSTRAKVTKSVKKVAKRRAS